MDAGRVTIVIRPVWLIFIFLSSPARAGTEGLLHGAGIVLV